ncbi:Ig-like domain-containing protein [Hafnia sp.]|uniref:Ig-like domain-containing protein n=1 Tax=Hafnia sp. TaxID=1873498 RepID=UPI003FA57A0C
MRLPKLPEIKLPTWMDKGEPLTLAHASRRYWEKVHEWLTWPLAQIDIDTCAEPLLNLLAYQRNITRFNGESLPLFRLRVKHAFINAQDAGERAGFEKIFKRLEIGEVQTLERQLAYDWDVILLRINDEQLSRSNTLMMQLVRQYGRTCRRYFLDVLTTPHPVSLGPATFDHDARCYSARMIRRVKGIHLTPEVLTLQPGETGYVRVDVTPPDAENQDYGSAVAQSDIATHTQSERTITLQGKQLGETTLSVTTVDGHHQAQAHIRVRIPDVVVVKIRYGASLMPLFYVSQEESSGDFTLDYGDGIDDKQYRIDTQGAVYSTRSIQPGTEFTLVIKGCESCRFYGARDVNDVLDVIRVSGMRTTIAGMFQNCRALHTVHPGAFSQCPNVTDASYLFAYCYALTVLPEGLFADTPSITLYENTFRHCKELVQLPSNLFAHPNAARSFRYAFYHCYALTTLPAGIFDGCTQAENLTFAFSNCRALTTLPPNLFSTCSNVRQFNSVFSECGALDSLPEGMFYGCHQNAVLDSAFYRCAKLSALPARLFGGDMQKIKLNSTFEYCAALSAIPVDIFSRVCVTSLYRTFKGCLKITDIPGNLLETSRAEISSITEAFAGSGVKRIPEGLLANLSRVGSFEGIFEGCTQLNEIPEGLFAGAVSAYSFARAFRNTQLNRIPGGLFSGCARANDFRATFQGCAHLTEIAPALFADMVAASNFTSTFEQCTSLERLPSALFAGLSKAESFDNVFKECSVLTAIPEDTFAHCNALYRLEFAFANCDALTSLPATLLADCIMLRQAASMLSGCVNLATVPANLFGAAHYLRHVNGMFSGCSHLNSDVNDIFPDAQYPTLMNINSLFASCSRLRGSGLSLIKKLSTVTYTAAALNGCTSLDDYATLPTTWK